ncbi:tetraspanin-32 [Carlito syrichta]|uniref:Tetraspanin-32 n=1 Tax=Carlito syrichta TaxID=1868482 RepID=A0A1U7UIF5_CARSF|nr:tetraspanin-32 [Carlito syrichta]
MGPWSRVRAAKCQMLVTGFFVLLLGLCVATVSGLTYFGAHFAVISRASLERNPYEAMHRGAFLVGVSLGGLLALGAVLSAAAAVREAQGLMAGAFLCFALAFCALVQVLFWKFHNPTQVEDAMLDTYDLVYDQAVRTASHVRRQELAAIQDMFLCCGKSSPFSRLGGAEAGLCQGEDAKREDCLQGLPSYLRTQQHVASTLTSVGLALTAYALLLSAFLWLAIRSGRSLDRRGKYALAPRAHGFQSPEPRLLRHPQGGLTCHPPSEADAAGDHQGPRGHSGSPWRRQDRYALPQPLFCPMACGPFALASVSACSTFFQLEKLSD